MRQHTYEFTTDIWYKGIQYFAAGDQITDPQLIPFPEVYGMTDARPDGVILRAPQFSQLNRLSAIAVSTNNFVEVYVEDSL